MAANSCIHNINNCSGSGKINSLFNLISHQPDIYKIYLHNKDSYKVKYQLPIKEKESTGLKNLNDSKLYGWCLYG